MNIIIEEKVPTETCEIDYSFQDKFLALETEYNLNYTLPLLQQISGFYNIPYNRIKKQDLITLIVNFEINNDNLEFVEERKRLWYYMQELKQNKYLSKYIIFM